MVTKVAAKRAASWKLSTSKAWKMTSLIDDLNEFKFPSLKSLKVKKQEGQGETLHYLWIQLKSYFYLSEARELRECYLVLTEMFTKCFSAYNQKTWAESIPTSIFEMYRLKQNDKGTLRWIHSWVHFRIIFKLFSWPAERVTESALWDQLQWKLLHYDSNAEWYQCNILKKDVLPTCNDLLFCLSHSSYRKGDTGSAL